jgi:hypothetical protein
MSQNNGKYGKQNSIFTHPHPQADRKEFKHEWDSILEKNPGIRHLVRPDYQHNYYDPPHDETTGEFLKKLNRTLPFRRHALIRRFLPKELYQYKALVSKLPYAQLQQLREQLYIGRIGDLGTNAPCTFSRRHWVYRVCNGNNGGGGDGGRGSTTSGDNQGDFNQYNGAIITSDTLKQLPLGEVLRWYKTSINNIYVDCAEEEYLRYKFCLAGRMPLVNNASLHNPLHYDPSDAEHLLDSIPYPACEALLPMVHDSHRYFTHVINEQCRNHFQPFYLALVQKRDLNEALMTYEQLQRCAIGREIRARAVCDAPRFAGAWQIFGRNFGFFAPKFLTNWITIKNNDVLKFSEPDSDLFPQNTKLKGLIDELRAELIAEGKLAPVVSGSQRNTHSDNKLNENNGNFGNLGNLFNEITNLSILSPFSSFFMSKNNIPSHYVSPNALTYDVDEKNKTPYRYIKSDLTVTEAREAVALMAQPAALDVINKSNNLKKLNNFSQNNYENFHQNDQNNSKNISNFYGSSFNIFSTPGNEQERLRAEYEEKYGHGVIVTSPNAQGEGYSMNNNHHTFTNFEKNDQNNNNTNTTTPPPFQIIDQQFSNELRGDIDPTTHSKLLLETFNNQQNDYERFNSS